MPSFDHIAQTALFFTKTFFIGGVKKGGGGTYFKWRIQKETAQAELLSQNV